MATWDDVRRAAAALPGTVEEARADGHSSWRVNGKTFAWDRPLRKADRAALGAAAPDGEVLAIRVPDLDAKEALIADDPEICFTTPHFDGYPAVLTRLELLDAAGVELLLRTAWESRAPRRLLADRDGQPPR